MELLWDVSSVGRTPALQAGGHRFKSDTLHENIFGNFSVVVNCTYHGMCEVGPTPTLSPNYSAVV